MHIVHEILRFSYNIHSIFLDSFAFFCIIQTLRGQKKAVENYEGKKKEK